MPQNQTVDFSDALVPNTGATDFSDALVAKNTSPATTPLSAKPLPAQPGPALARQQFLRKTAPNLTEEGVMGATAGLLPPIGATLGEMTPAGPVGAGVGAGLGTEAERLLGQKPTHTEAAENALFYGGTSGIMKGVGKLADWLGLLGPKTTPEIWSAENEVLGVPKGEISLPLGAKGPEAAFIDPGRAVVERAGITPQELV